MNLPENLTLLNYVTSNGSTYIQTDIYVSNELGVEAKAARTWPFGNDSERNSKYIVNARTLGGGQGENNYFNLPFHWYAGSKIVVGFGRRVETSIESPYVLGTPYTSSINLYNSGEAVWNGKVFHTFDRKAFTPDKWCNRPLPILAFVNDDGVYAVYNWIGDFYYALFTLGEEIYRYFVPVLDNNTNRACLYEAIEGKTYLPVGSGFTGWG